MTTRVIMWIECYVSMARPVFIPFFIYNYICTSMTVRHGNTRYIFLLSPAADIPTGDGHDVMTRDRISQQLSS